MGMVSAFCSSLRAGAPAEQKYPLVGIIILNWNGLQDTRECIESIQQTDYPNLDIILVDNASKNNDEPALLQQEFPQLKIIRNNENLGFSGGNNTGINFALDQGAEYIFLLNNDAFVTETLLSDLVNAAAAHPEIGMLGPTIVSYFDRAHEYVGAVYNRRHASAYEYLRSSANLPDLIDTEYVPGCAVLVPSPVIQKIGLLDESFFAYYEDVDWSLRCRDAGYRVAVVTTTKVFHKGTTDQVRLKSPFSQYLLVRNQWQFMRKYGRWFEWPGFIRQYVRQMILNVAKYDENGEDEQADAWLSGFWAGLTGKTGGGFFEAPSFMKRLVQDNIRFWLWFTGLFFVVEYQLKKAGNRKESAS